MSDTSTFSLGGHLRGAAAWLFAKFQSVPPLLSLPAIGLAAWFATPYVVSLAQGRGVDVTDPANAGETGGTIASPRGDLVAQTPVSGPGASVPAATAAVASLLSRPVTASAIPSWLPLPAPPAPGKAAPKPVPSYRTVQHLVPSMPRLKTAGRAAELMSQQRFAERLVAPSGFGQGRAPTSMMPGMRNTLQTGRSAFTGGSQQWRMGSWGARGSFGMQPGFASNRNFGMRGFGGFRGGGFGGGGFHGGGR